MKESFSLKKGNDFDFPFYLVVIFILFEYGRPQSFFPIIGELHVGMAIQILMLFCLFFKNKLLDLKDIQTKCFLCLIILMTFHVPTALNNYWAFQYWKSTILYFIIYLSIKNFVNSFPRIDYCINSWIIINLMNAIIGIINKGIIPNSSFMGDENDFALVMNMMIPFAFFNLLIARSLRGKAFYLIAMAMFIIANIASLSRGGFVGFIAVAIYCLYKSPKKIASILAITLLLSLVLVYVPVKYWDEIKTIPKSTQLGDTGEHRLYLWGCAWRMFLDNPLVGVGQGNGPWNISKYEPREGWYGRSEASRVFHSLYFTIIAELGIIGAFLFMGMLFPSFRDTKRILKLGEKYSNNQVENQTRNGFLHLKESKFIVLSIRASLITYLVSGGFLSVLYYPHFWLLLALSVALKNMCPQLAINNAKGVSYGERPKMDEALRLRKGPLA